MTDGGQQPGQARRLLGREVDELVAPRRSDRFDGPGRGVLDPRPLRLAIARILGAVVVTVQGELDLGTSVVLGQRLEDLIDGQGNLFVVVDLREMVLGDPAGLGVLAKANHRMEERGGQFVLASPSAATDRALRAAGLAEAIEAHAERRYHPSVVRSPGPAPIRAAARRSDVDPGGRSTGS